MVKVAGDPQVESRAAAVPFQRLNAGGAFGQNIGQGAQRLGADVTKFADERQQEDDIAITKERVSRYRDFSRQRLYTDEDSYMSRKGRAAYDSHSAIEQELEDFRKSLGEGLSPNQQKLVGPVLDDYRHRDASAIGRHSQKARVDWLNEQDTTAVTQAQLDGALMWNDNAASVTQIKGAVGNLGRRNGWSPEKVELEQQKQLSGMHISAIDNILSQNPKAAEAYYDANKADILPTMHDEVKNKIKDQNIGVEAQGIADVIRISGGNLSERYAQVTSIEDPDVRKLVRGLVEHDYKIGKIAEEEAIESVYEELGEAMLGGQKAIDWSLEHPDKWASLPVDTRAAALKGAAGQFTHKAYNKMTDLIADNKTDEALSFLRKHPEQFTDADYKSFSKDLRNNESSSLKGFQTRHQRLQGKLKPLDLNDEDRALFSAQLEQSYRDYQLVHDKLPDASAEDEMVDQLVIQAYDAPFLSFESDKYGFEQVDKDLADVIARYQSEYGQTPSDEQIAETRLEILRYYGQ